MANQQVRVGQVWDLGQRNYMRITGFDSIGARFHDGSCWRGMKEGDSAPEWWAPVKGPAFDPVAVDVEKHRDRLQELNTELTLKNRELVAQYTKAADRILELEALLKLGALMAVKPIRLWTTSPVQQGDVWENDLRKVRFTVCDVAGREALLKASGSAIRRWLDTADVLADYTLVERDGKAAR